MRWLLRVGSVALVLALSTAGARAGDAPGDDARAGLALLEDRGCAACHSTDGTARVGPSLLGLFGTRVELTSGTALVDRDYLRRAIREPDADLRIGFPAHTMPVLDLDDRELDQVVAAIEHLGAADVVRDRHRDEGTLWMLIAGALLFVLGHLTLSSEPVRARVLARIGAGGFQGVYTVVALAGFTFLVWGWIRAPYIAVWTPPLWTRHVPLAVMPLSLFFLVGGFVGKNPTSVGQERALATHPPPHGVLTLTRHPGLWGFALWALAHVPPNGDVATLILVGSIATLAFAGMVHIDRRRARALGDDWQAYAAQTSRWPLVAVVTGRTRIDARGLVVPAVIAAGLYVALLFGHEWVIGVTALPY